jgi:hypothetical protein
MQNREELRQKVHKGVKNTFGERGKDIIFRKKGGESILYSDQNTDPCNF